MIKNKIYIIVIFSSIALIGLIISQAFWVNKAINLSQKHFENRAYAAICNAIREIEKKSNNTQMQYSENHYENIINILKKNNIDSLLNKHMIFNRISNKFEYAIVFSPKDSIIYKTDNFTNNVSSEKVFKKCLNNLYDKASFHIEFLFPNKNKTILYDIWVWLTISVFFILIIVFCFCLIVLTVFRQKKLSEMKSDFINNMTHEFKTPISTISLASEILINTDGCKQPEKIKQYGKIVQEEINRMKIQVEQVLRMAQLDKNEYELNKEEVDIHDLIQNAIHNLFIEEIDKRVSIQYKFEALQSSIMVDPIHFSNIIKNLIDNSCKYSNGSNLQIEISTLNVAEGIKISIADNGIGIAPEYQKYIFDKFYRVPTGNVHNVKGTGIGLYYVKVMTEAHGGTITVDSQVGKGTRFDIIFPI